MTALHSLISQGVEAVKRTLVLRYCLVGEHPLQDSERLLCEKCLRSLPTLPPPQIPYGWDSKASPLDDALSYWEFSPSLQRLIHELKYRRKPLIGELLGAYLARGMETSLLPGADLLIPVPLHPVRQRERGYNQAAAIARGMSSVLDVPVQESVLHRQRYTASQTALSRQERRNNLLGAFDISAPGMELIQGKNILLVDDVFTTGATSEAAAQVLKAGGVHSVCAISLASASLDSQGSAAPLTQVGSAAP